MSIPTAFYVTITTEAAAENYKQVATDFVRAFYTVTTTKLTEFTKPHLTNPWCDVEVSMEGSTIQGCMVLLAGAPKAWSLDKNKLTALLRTELPFTVKLTKRSVDKAELDKVLEKAQMVEDTERDAERHSQ